MFRLWMTFLQNAHHSWIERLRSVARTNLSIKSPQFRGRFSAAILTTLKSGVFASLPVFGADVGSAHLEHIHKLDLPAWKKSALKHSQTFSCAKFEFMDMLLGGPLS
jgi:hypothetical protein